MPQEKANDGIYNNSFWDSRETINTVSYTHLDVYKRQGWMTGTIFENYIKHFIKNVKFLVEKLVIVILDNHKSHIYPSASQLCKNNGITPVTLSPHTSYKLQPLDRTVFGPFKTSYNQAAVTL